MSISKNFAWESDGFSYIQSKYMLNISLIFQLWFSPKEDF